MTIPMFVTAALFFHGFRGIITSHNMAVKAIVFVMPWSGLFINLGPTLQISDVLVAFYALIILFLRPNLIKLPKWILFLVAFVFMSIISALISMSKGVSYQISVANWAVSAEGRLATQVFKYTMWTCFLIIICSVKNYLKLESVSRTLVISIAVLSVLGLVQFFVFLLFGIDLFPIGHEQRTAIISGNIRITSFAGEPKGFATTLAVGISLLLFLNKDLSFNRSTRLSLLFLFFTCLILTASSSGFFLFFVVCVFFIISKLGQKNLSQISCVSSSISIFFGVMFFFFYLGSTTDILSPLSYRETYGIIDIIHYQTVERFRLDDTDAVYISYFLNNPDRMIFGLGLGLGYTEAMSYIPSHQEYYMFNTVMPPKSGVIEVFVASGVLGMLLFSLGLGFSVVTSTSDRDLQKMRLRELQYLSLGLIMMLSLRMYDAFLILTILTLLYCMGRKISVRI